MPRPLQLHKLLGGGAVRSRPYSLGARDRRPLRSRLAYAGLTPYPANFSPETTVRRGPRSRSRRTRRLNEEQETTGSTTLLRARCKSNDSSLSVEEKEENSSTVTLHTNPKFNADISPSTSKSNGKLKKKQSGSTKNMDESETLNKQETADSGSKNKGSEDSLLKEYESIERRAAEMYARQEKPTTSKQSLLKTNPKN